MIGYTHILIQKAAEEIAGAFYERAASLDPDFYKAWPKQRSFIRKNWHSFIPAAREHLTQMLRLDYSDHVKNEIYEALVNDRSINPAVRETVH